MRNKTGLLGTAVGLATFLLVGGAAIAQNPEAKFRMFESSLDTMVSPSVIREEPTGERKYPVFFFKDTHGTFDVTVNLTEDPAQAMDVAYTLGGTAVQGVHYIVTAGSSPLTFQANEKDKIITIEILDPGLYYKEKRLDFTIDPIGTDPPVDVDNDKLFAFIRSTTAPPSIEFASATSYPTPGSVHSIQVNKLPSAPHEDDVNLYFTISPLSTAVKGLDYTLTSDALHGASSITPAGSNTPMQITVPGTATPGRTLILDLYHERADESDKNLWTYSESLLFDNDGDLSVGGPVFPTILADHAPGPLTAVQAYGGNPLEADFDTMQTDPLGAWLPTARLKANSTVKGYLRKNSEAQFHCAGTTTLHNLEQYTRVSMYLRKADGIDLPDLFMFYIRNRSANLEKHVVVNTNYAGLDGVDYEGRTWGIECTHNGSPINGPPLISELTAGIDLVEHRFPDGTPEVLLRVWLTYDADPVELGGFTNVIMWPSWYPTSPDTCTSTGTLQPDRGLAVYNIYHEMSDTLIQGPPGRYFPRTGMAWEPIGNAVIPVSSTKSTHTMTIASSQPSIGTSLCGPAAINATGQPGIVRAFGSSVFADGCVTVEMSQIPANEIGIIFTSLTTAGGPICVGQPLVRHKHILVGPSDQVVVDFDTLMPLGMFGVGSTLYFQGWYRDTLAPGKFTNSVGVILQ